jgi:hypothetical protein
MSTQSSRPAAVAAEIDGASSKRGVTLALLDKALSLHGPLPERHVARLHRNRPDATPRQVVGRLNAELRATTISTGVGVGATAAAPGVGTGVALAVSGGETIAFLNATVLYILARAVVHGIKIENVERRRTLVMAVMLGEAGAGTVGKMAEKTGKHWAKHIVSAIPMSKINAVNKVLGQHFVTKYGTKQGIIVLGRVVPFGIGAVIGGTANGLMTQATIKAADRAFGTPPDAWEELRVVPTPPDAWEELRVVPDSPS